MTMIKTNDLIGAALNWAVAKSEDWHIADDYWISDPREKGTGQPMSDFNPSSDWAQGGPIIERELITLDCQFDANEWHAWTPAPERETGEARAVGLTPLIAAMRCYVASKLGDDVDIPSGLI